MTQPSNAINELTKYPAYIQELTSALQTEMSKLRGLDAYGTAFVGICAHLYNEKTYVKVEDCRSLYRQQGLKGLAMLMRAKELELLCVGLAYRYESLGGGKDGEVGFSVVAGNRAEYLQIAWPDSGKPYFVIDSHTSSSSRSLTCPPELLDALNPERPELS